MRGKRLSGSVLALITAAFLTRGSTPAAGDLMKGKKRTDRTIRLEGVVDAPPSEVYRLWTTEEGVKRFFAPAARIGSRPGEEYTIAFFPDEDPEALVHGTRGARILELVPGKKLSFEWVTFAGDQKRDDHAPPYAEPALRNASPLPTWVELTFDPVEGDPSRTLVRFRHYGFGKGPLWEKSFHWFERAWGGVLGGLKTACEKSARSAPASGR
ncbi:MAG: SRPBCC domain-containing protein [Acidobacteriota bacterium]|nr:SRPBCC domain-containing protein [Acidobacteriota bacterium]